MRKHSLPLARFAKARCLPGQKSCPVYMKLVALFRGIVFIGCELLAVNRARVFL